MISHSLYWYAHMLGIALLILSIGGVTLHAMSGGTKETSGGRGIVAASHGLGLLLILVAGFGMLARLELFGDGLPGWVMAKLAIWVLIGFAFVVPYRRPELSRLVWFGAALLMLLAAILAHSKPF